MDPIRDLIRDILHLEPDDVVFGVAVALAIIAIFLVIFLMVVFAIA